MNVDLRAKLLSVTEERDVIDFSFELIQFIFP